MKMSVQGDKGILPAVEAVLCQIAEENNSGFLNLERRCINCAGCKKCTYLQITRQKSPKDLIKIQKFSDRLSLLDNGMVVPENEARYRILFDPIFITTQEEIDRIFHPRYSNLEEAKVATLKLIRKYKREPQKIKEAQEGVQKEFETGKLIKIYPGTDQWDEILGGTHFFAFLNFAFSMSSLSTSTRLIMDASRKPKHTALPPSMMVETVNNAMGSMLLALISFRLYKFAFSADIRKCFHQIATTLDFAKLNLCYWFDEPMEEKGDCILLKTVCQFGHTYCNVALELGIAKYPYKDSCDEDTKFAMDEARFADNCTPSFSTKEGMDKVAKELDFLFRKYSLDLKHILISHDLLPPDDPRLQIPRENVYGITWDLGQDSLRANINPTIYSKKRGVLKGPTIDIELPTREQITRRNLAVLCATVGSRDQVLLGPITLALKAYLSRACEIHDKERYDDPLDMSSPELVDSVMEFLVRIKKYKDVKPLERAIIPANYVVSRFLLFHDGSTLSSAYSIYIQSVDQGTLGNVKTALLRVNHRLSKRTVPVTEMISRSQALEGLLEVVPVLARTLRNHTFQISIITDSLCCAELLNPSRESSAHILSSNAQLQRNLIDELSNIFSRAQIRCIWVQSDLNKADYLTRIQKDPIGLLNSKAYREAAGSAEFMGRLEQANAFYIKEPGKQAVYSSPTAFDRSLLIKDSRGKWVTYNARPDLRNAPSEESGTTKFLEDVHCNHCQGGIYTCPHSEEYVTESHIDLGSLVDLKKKSLAVIKGVNIVTRAMAKQLPRQLSFSIPESFWLWYQSRIWTKSWDTIPILTSYTPVLEDYLDREEYARLLSKHFSLKKFLLHMVFVVMKILLMQGKLDEQVNLIGEAWAYVIRTSQFAYKLTHASRLEVIRKEGIVMAVRRRLASLDFPKLLPIISASDVGLMFKVIRHYHTVTEGNQRWPLVNFHHGVDRTIGYIRDSGFGVHFPKSRLIVATFLAGCGPCNLKDERTLEYAMGHRSKNVEGQADNFPFSFVAIDNIGPFRVAQGIGSRLTSKVWALVIMDLFSSEVQVFGMDNLSSATIGMSLCRLQALKGTRIKKVYCDNFASFGQAAIGALNLEEFNVALRESLTSQGLVMEPLEMAPNLSFAKHRSLSERRIRDVKGYLKQVRGSVESKVLPLLTVNQLQLVMDIICGTLNHVPISSSSGVCPAHFSSPRTVPGVFMIPEPMKSLKYIERMDAYITLVNTAITEKLMATEKAVLGVRLGDRRMKLEEGQIVWFYRSEDFPDQGICFGEISMIQGANSVVKLSDSIAKELPNSRLHLYVPCAETYVSAWRHKLGIES